MAAEATSQRIPCANCGAMILPITTKSYNGLCAPCAIKARPAQDPDVAAKSRKQPPEKTIRNCAIEFRFRCPHDWNRLDVTEDENVRFCNNCAQKVFFCTSDAEVIAHARLGQCIAMREPDRSINERILMGFVGASPPLNLEEQAALAAVRHDKRMTKALHGARYASRNCPECGIPCPDWYERCLACGHQVGIVKSTG